MRGNTNHARGIGRWAFAAVSQNMAAVATRASSPGIVTLAGQRASTGHGGIGAAHDAAAVTVTGPVAHHWPTVTVTVTLVRATTGKGLELAGELPAAQAPGPVTAACSAAAAKTCTYLGVKVQVARANG